MPNTGRARMISKLFTQAEKLALAEVKQRAREILRTHPSLDEFVMGMGSWSFTIRDSTKMCNDKRILSAGDNVDDNDLKYLRPFARFIDEWDPYLHLTGTPMRFTATGKKVTDW